MHIMVETYRHKSLRAQLRMFQSYQNLVYLQEITHE